MKNILLILIIVLSTNIEVFSQEVVNMTKEGGVYTIPCEINGLRLRFIFDTGASDVSISLSEALFMLKNGYLSKYDIKGSNYYQIANGDFVEGTTINLRRIKIGSRTLYNIEASIVHSLSSPLLLGQSALSKMGKYSFDYSNNTLVFGKSNYSSAGNSTSKYRNYNTTQEKTITTTLKMDAKLRSSDSPFSSVVKHLPKGASVRVIENKGNYWKIFYDGKTGYLNEMSLNITYNMSKLNSTESSSTSKSSNTNSSYNTIITTLKMDAKLRSSDSPFSSVVKHVPKGASVIVIGNKGNYWKIFYDGKTGYLNEMSLNITYNMSLIKN